MSRSKMKKGDGPSLTLCEELLAELANGRLPMPPPARPATKEELELLCVVFGLDPDELTDDR